ncbi:MAG: cupin domain-containing protein [Bacteroidota bacterium]
MNTLALNLIEKFDSISEYWSPKIVAELNGQYVKIAKIKGEFVWHNHQNEDELFYVLKGEMHLHFKENTINLKKGEMYTVPKGIEHKPEAPEECWIMMFEPKETLNTGSTQSEMTREKLDWA